MNKFYRFLFVVMLTTGTCFQTNAQWNQDVSQNLLISEPGYEGQDLVQVGKTSDDKIFISWISWEDQNAYIKLQLLDKDGNALFEEGGMYVSKHPTPTWSSGYGLAVSQDDCAVIVNSDTRNGSWLPYIYKISQEGEQLWGVEGINLFNQTGDAGINPHVCITRKNNTIVSFTKLGDDENGVVALSKILPDGTKAWGGNITIDDTNGTFNLIPSGEDNFIIAYYTNSNCYIAQKYTTNGEEAWADKVYLDDTGTVAGQVEANWISDGEGGFFAGYRFAIQTASYGTMQGVSSDGELKFDGEKIVLSGMPVLCLHPANGAVYAACSTVDIFEGSNIYFGQFTTDGNPVRQIDELMSDVAYQYSIYGMVPVDDGLFIIYRNATDYDKATIEYTKVNLEGKVLSENISVCSTGSNKGRGSIAVLENQCVLTWIDQYGSMNTGGKIYAQNIECENRNSISLVSGDDKRFRIYPSGNRQYRIEAEVDKACNLFLQLTDYSGRQISSTKVQFDCGTNSSTYSVPGLSPGVYLLSVSTDAGFHSLHKLVIQ